MKKLLILLTLLLTISLTIITIPEAIAAPTQAKPGIEVFQPNQSKTVALGSDLFTLKQLVNQDSSKTVSLVEITLPPKSQGSLLFKKHVLESPEDIYILDGELELFGSQPNERIEAKTGTIIQIPASLPYGIGNTGTQPGRILVVSKNLGLANLLEEVGTPVVDQSAIPSDVTPDITKVTAVAQKYGIKFLN